jgi:ribosomal protein S27AE
LYSIDLQRKKKARWFYANRPTPNAGLFVEHGNKDYVYRIVYTGVVMTAKLLEAADRVLQLMANPELEDLEDCPNDLASIQRLVNFRHYQQQASQELFASKRFCPQCCGSVMTNFSRNPNIKRKRPRGMRHYL